MADEISSVAGNQLIPLVDLLRTDFTLQFSLVVLVVALVGIFVISKKISHMLDGKKFKYVRPYATTFVKKILFSLFAVVIIISISFYIQVFELFDTQIAIDAANANASLTPRETFAKILDTFVILILGYTIGQLIPIVISNYESQNRAKHDYQQWIHMRGFADDKDNLFHKLFEWVAPKHGPSEMPEELFQEKLQTVEGRNFLENYYTSKGIPIGSFKRKQSNAFKKWRQSERDKYEKYYDDCTNGNNESGQVLHPGSFPSEIYTITLWREQKRISNYDPIIPGARPPGRAERKGIDSTKSFKQMIPLTTFLGIILGIAAW